MTNNGTVSINSTNFTNLIHDFQLLYQLTPYLSGMYSDEITYKDVIRSLILSYSEDNFEFLAFERSQRHRLYIVLYELCIPYTKHRIDNNYAIITLNINNDVRNYVRSPNVNNLAPLKNFKPIISNNMQKKLQLSDIIFDIKETLTDSMFKKIMDTLAEITD